VRKAEGIERDDKRFYERKEVVPNDNFKGGVTGAPYLFYIQMNVTKDLRRNSQRSWLLFSRSLPGREGGEWMLRFRERRSSGSPFSQREEGLPSKGQESSTLETESLQKQKNERGSPDK